MSTQQISIVSDNVNSTLEHYRDELGFRIDSVYPADSPRRARLSGHGLEVLIHDGAGEAEPDDSLPDNQPSLVVAEFGKGGFGTGRAGMQYRDLIPDRYGGRFIASHIRIEQGGPVPDYVHHHHIRFQFIHCVNGWVRVAYEDQGEPMLLKAGDFFLQPPHIRHRVLECSDSMEVVEIACPAEHETLVDHEMTLPTGRLDPERDFGGQTFVYSQSEETPWQGENGIEFQDSGIGDATRGAVAARTVRLANGGNQWSLQHDADVRIVFVRSGQAVLVTPEGEQRELVKADACAIPPGAAYGLASVSADFVALDVLAPAPGGRLD